jgi:hypothetical protein
MQHQQQVLPLSLVGESVLQCYSKTAGQAVISVLSLCPAEYQAQLQNLKILLPYTSCTVFTFAMKSIQTTEQAQNFLFLTKILICNMRLTTYLNRNPTDRTHSLHMHLGLI